MKLLDVRKIAFHGQTGDERSPEDFAFPAAMTSMMEYLGEDVGLETIEAHGRSYLRRAANNAFVAASGIGFALLWDKTLCGSAMDLLQAAPYDRGIENAFAWAGWAYERVSGERMKRAAADSIAAGRPLIALGLTDVPEAALVCGCDETAGTLAGWSHFQEGMETAENGMFVVSGWEGHTWELIVPTRRIARFFDVRDIVREGVRIMRQESVEGYQAGDAAYEAWIAALRAQENAPEGLFDYHHAILFNMAEARCWCGDFLLSQGVEAGVHFKTIHDLCWKADAAVRSAQELNDSDKRAELIRALRAIQEEDRAAMDELCDYLEL